MAPPLSLVECGADELAGRLSRALATPGDRAVTDEARRTALAWLEAGAASHRRAFLLRRAGTAVGVVCYEEALSLAEGRVASLPLLELDAPGLWGSALAAATMHARARGCQLLEAQPPPGEPALVGALRRRGFRRRAAALHVIGLRTLAARLERLRHPALPSGWTLRHAASGEGERLLDLLAAFYREDGGAVEREVLGRRLALAAVTGSPAGSERGHLVLARGGELAGTVALAASLALDGTRQGVIADYYVAPAHRGQGLGAALFAEVLRRLAAAGADVACGWVETSNHAALRFWGAHATRQAAEIWFVPL